MEFPENIAALRRMLADCTLCPRNCHVNRAAGAVGACRAPAEAVIAHAGLHYGEERCLVGQFGSGAIFFAGCSLACVYCQNADISQHIGGKRASSEVVAEAMVKLQDDTCENINFVTPTHYAHIVAEAVHLARADGLTVPIVYNCAGYESVATLKLLAGLVDIYMPDFKYASATAGHKYSGVSDYPAVALAAVREMYRQVGPLKLDSRGVAVRGLLVRHLVLPSDIGGGKYVVQAVAKIAPGAAINIMDQYRPEHHAHQFQELLRLVDPAEVKALRDLARASKLRVLTD